MRIEPMEYPLWGPLQKLFWKDLRTCKRFMCMFGVQLDGGRQLVAYKHIDTRKYVYINVATGASYIQDTIPGATTLQKVEADVARAHVLR